MATLNTGSVAGGVVGAGSTLALREMQDPTGSSSVTRPSVLWGLGTGLGALGVAWGMDNRMIPRMGGRMLSDALWAYGIGATAAGAGSAVYPVGNSLTEPEVPSLPA